VLLAIALSLTVLCSTFDPEAAAQREADRQQHLAGDQALATVPSFDYPIPIQEARRADPSRRP
jgi:hypothetical protein